MAKMAAEGHRVVLVTATRGELGEVPDGLLAPGETLARAARHRAGRGLCAVLGRGPPRVSRLPGLGDGRLSPPTTTRPASGRPTSTRRRHAWPPSSTKRTPRSSPPTTRTAGTAIPTTSRCTASGCAPPSEPRTARVFMATMNRDHLLSLADRARRVRSGHARRATGHDRHHGRARRAHHHRRGRERLPGPQTPAPWRCTPVRSPTPRSSSPCRPKRSRRCGAPSGTSASAPRAGPESRTRLLARAMTPAATGRTTTSRPSSSGEKEPCSPSSAICAAGVDRKLEHLSDDDARRGSWRRSTTLLGLVKHLASVEVYWAPTTLRRRRRR